MERVIKTGVGWRIGWNPQETAEFKGLIGTDEWAIELTESELQDFCRLAVQLAETMRQLNSELMDEEKITCEAESNLIWLEVSGYAQRYNLRFILLSGRGAEGSWNEDSVMGLLQGAQTLQVF